MRSLAPLLFVLVLLASSPSLLRAEEKADPALAPHLDQQLEDREVFKHFETKWASKDMDHRLLALRSLGKWRHEKVLKRLKKIWLKEREYELKAAAAEGLGQQKPFAKDAGRALVRGLGEMKDLASRVEPDAEEELDQTLEARALVAGIHAMGELGRTRAWEDGWKSLKGYIEHPHDDVAGEMMLVCGRLKEYRALAILLEWFNFYPDGYSYSGGTVKVDTGAAGNRDARAAKAKWKAKYGSRARKARPMAWDKMVQAVEMITGEKFSKPEELAAWMKKNKALLKKHGA